MKNNNAARAVPDEKAFEPDRILRGLEFLQQCHADSQGFAVVTSGDTASISSLLQRFVQSHDRDRAALLTRPVTDAGEFLQAILGRFGFEAFEASTEDLANLLNVYVRHEAAENGPVVIALERAEAFGPRVFDMICRLSALRISGGPAILFVLGGSHALNRVLTSRALRGTAVPAAPRCALDRLPDGGPGEAATPPHPVPGRSAPAGAELIVSLDGNRIRRYALDRGQLLIGRAEQNDVQLASRFVSRHHALLLTRPEGSYVTDLKSTNGTFINSLPVAQHALRDGDIIIIGNFQLLYSDAQHRCGSRWQPVGITDVGSSQRPERTTH